MDIKSEPNDEELEDSPDLIDPGQIKTETLDVNNALTSETLKCPICSEVFNCEYFLKVHQMLHDPKQYCFICKRNYTQNFDVHVIGKHFNQCELCLQTFTVKKGLTKHMQLHTGNLTYVKCNECDKAFRHKGSLDLHIRSIHQGVKPYSCSICEPSINFTTHSAYKRHMKRFHDPNNPHEDKRIKEHICSYCCIPVYSLKEKMIHEAQHGALKTCEECSLIFETDKRIKEHICSYCCIPVYSLKEKMIHEAQHGALKTCEECSLIFETVAETKKHFGLVHKKPGMFTCAECWMSFKHKHTLNYHIKTTHDGKKFECVECDIRFVSLRNYKAHEKKFHDPDNPYKLSELARYCKICNITLSTIGEKKQHMKQHKKSLYKERKCFFCPEVFVLYSHFHKHLLTHNKPLNCEICGRNLRHVNIENHKRFHDTGKVQTCGICNSVTTNLQKHLQRLHFCTLCNETIKLVTTYGMRIHYKKNHPDMIKCPKCPAVMSKSEIKNHMKEKHKFDQFYECDKCWKYFYHYASFQVHKRKHSSKVNRCNKCLLKFRFEKHYKLHNCENKEELHCYICDVDYLDGHLLSRHMKESHSPTVFASVEELETPNKFQFQEVEDTYNGKSMKYQCLRCFMVMRNKNISHVCKLKSRLMEHYKCNICGLLATGQRTIIKHGRRAHGGDIQWTRISGKIYTKKGLNKPNYYNNTVGKDYSYRCKRCGKRFKYELSLKEHCCDKTRAKLHHCPICDTKYSSSKYFNNHMRFYHSPRIILDVKEEKELEEKIMKESTLLIDRSKKYQCKRCLTVIENVRSVKNHQCGVRRANILHDNYYWRGIKRVKRTCSQCGYTCLSLNTMRNHTSNYHSMLKAGPVEENEVEREVKMEIDIEEVKVNPDPEILAECDIKTEDPLG